MNDVWFKLADKSAQANRSHGIGKRRLIVLPAFPRKTGQCAELSQTMNVDAVVILA